MGIRPDKQSLLCIYIECSALGFSFNNNALKQGRCNTSFLYAYLHQMSAAAHVAPGALRAYTTISIQACCDT